MCRRKRKCACAGKAEIKMKKPPVFGRFLFFLYKEKWEKRATAVARPPLGKEKEKLSL